MVSSFNFESTSILVNLVVASSKIKSLKTPIGFIRPNLHLIIYGSVGVGKSTILREVMNNLGIKSTVISLTTATILGSVDKNSGEFIPPAIWDARNSVLPLDEMYIPKEGNGRDVARTLLSIMEQPEYEKRFGYRCNEYKKKCGDLFCMVKDHKVSVKTRFSLIATTMMNLNAKAKLQNIDVQALTSRCLVVNFNPEIDEIIEMAKGKKPYVFQNILKKGEKLEKEVNIKEYNDIINYLTSRSDNIPKSDFLRTLGDLCRIYVLDKVNFRRNAELILVLRGGGHV